MLYVAYFITCSFLKLDLTCDASMPYGQVKFFEEFKLLKNFVTILLIKTFLGLVEINFGLVHASYSLPEWQAVKLAFFAPCLRSFMYPSEDGQSISLSLKTRILKSCIIFCFHFNLRSGMFFFFFKGGGGWEKKNVWYIYMYFTSR